VPDCKGVAPGPRCRCSSFPSPLNSHLCPLLPLLSISHLSFLSTLLCTPSSPSLSSRISPLFPDRSVSSSVRPEQHIDWSAYHGSVRRGNPLDPTGADRLDDSRRHQVPTCRGPHSHTDGSKVAAGAPLLELVAVDWFHSKAADGRASAGRKGGVVQRIREQKARTRRRSLWCSVLQVLTPINALLILHVPTLGLATGRSEGPLGTGICAEGLLAVPSPTGHPLYSSQPQTAEAWIRRDAAPQPLSGSGLFSSGDSAQKVPDARGGSRRAKLCSETS